MTGVKRCTWCKEEKSLEEFNKSSYTCRSCSREIGRRKYQQNKEAILERQRTKYAEDPDRFKEYSLKWRQNHPDKIREHDKKYRLKHPDKVKSKIKQWASKNPDKEKARLKRYYLSPKGQITFARLTHRRRVRDRESITTLTEVEWLDILKCQDNRCAICKKRFTDKRRPTKDHIIPLSKGGDLTRENVQALCNSCNCKKSAKVDPSLIQAWITFPIPTS